MDVSVIIVNWNTKALLRNCLMSIDEQAGDVDYEVIVVDNASSDGSAEMVRQEFPYARLIVEQTNSGYAAAINDGIKIAQGKYVLVLNSDMVICDGAIAKTVKYANAHPEAAVIGCQVRENPAKVQMTCFRFPSLLNLLLHTLGLARVFKYNRFLGREDMLWWQRDSERQVEVVSGMFMLVRREAILQVGLMDEGYFLYCEDTDWCYRFAKAEWELLFWPGAKVIHVHGGGHSTKQRVLETFLQQQKSLLRFFRKHYGTTNYLLARSLLAIYASLKCLESVITLLWRRILRENIAPEMAESRKYWGVFKLCVLPAEPEGSKSRCTRFILNLLKEIIEFACAIMYAVFLLIIRKKNRRLVMCYHSVRKQDVKRFKKQMAYLAKKCHVAKVSEIRSTPANAKEIVVGITFDDASVSVIENAVPILKKYGLPAGIFVPAGNLGEPPSWSVEHNCSDTDEIVMTEQQVVELDRKGFEIFSHTFSHPVLAEIEDSQLEAELVSSKHFLEKVVGHEVSVVSYPYGVHDTRVCDAAKRTGYKLGFTIEPRMVDSSPDNMKMGRFEVSPRDNPIKFRLKVSGAYQAVNYLRTLKKLFLSSPQ